MVLTTMTAIHHSGFTFIERPTYSPDFAPKTKAAISGTHFQFDNDFILVVDGFLSSQDKYVYTDEICLRLKNVMRIMYVAKKYCVDRLTSKCKQFVQKNINGNNACKLMDEAVKFSDEDIRQSCLQKIKKDTEACIQSQEFINICNESLELITKLEKITMKEESLYEQVIKWCDAECDRQQLAVTWLNKRNKHTFPSNEGAVLR
ncbi:hypothetical protein FSP39_013168 [Pinctada imbricata]|uniref:BACK domain-containing protein n=1 Tax=Pinctada imbricata TaxID=66713 RepID=A0AA88YUU6_PINIB|nr:hypothetical protein FSP39_013168 [Pinctada imbricata]